MSGRSDLAVAMQSSDTAMFLYDIPGGGALCPYHYEFIEEWLLVIDGQVTVRTPEGEHQMQPGTLSCFPAGPTGAHRITNPSASSARLLLLSGRRTPAVSVYPDSDKIGVTTGDPADDGLMFLRDTVVAHDHGEVGWTNADESGRALGRSDRQPRGRHAPPRRPHPWR